MNYEEIEAAIQEASWKQIRALMTACIKAGVEKSVWPTYCISIFVDRVERKLRRI